MQSLDFEFMCLLGLSVLRFYIDFENCIKSNPTSRNAHESHPFLTRVIHAKQQARVDDATFVQWMLDIKEAFRLHNCHAVSLVHAPPPNMSVDARPLLDRFSALEQVTAQTGMMCTKVWDTCKELLTLTRQQSARIHHLEQVLGGMQGPAMLPRVPYMGEAEVPFGNTEGANEEEDENATPTPFPGQIGKKTNMCYDIVLRKRYGSNGIPANKLFVSWFVEQLPIAYENYKAARRRDGGGDKAFHRRILTHFSVSKTAVHVILKNLDEYPQEGISAQDLEELANKALDKIAQDNNLKGRPSRTKLGDGKRSLFKTLGYMDEERHPFPSNTPPRVRAWFNARGFHNNRATGATGTNEVNVDAQQA